MKPAIEQLHANFEMLVAAWRTTSEAWQDRVQQRFEQKYLQHYEQTMRASDKELRRILETVQKAVEQCP